MIPYKVKYKIQVFECFEPDEAKMTDEQKKMNPCKGWSLNGKFTEVSPETLLKLGVSLPSIGGTLTR